jgi:tripartite-type tricarboxylate transporter receptor subunit TctC
MMPAVTRRTAIRMASAAAALVAAPAGLRAQAFPTRPVSLVVPYAAGGPTDVASRVIAEQLRVELGGPVVVENRPGASTIIGAQAVAAAPPDGHTMLMVTTTTLCTNPHLYRHLPYKAEDFAPVGMAVRVPLAVAIRSTLPATTIEEFRRYAQSRPGTLNYGSAGTGANSQLVNELMNARLGTPMTHVPYRGTALALKDLASGHVDALVDALATLLPLHQAGQIRILATFEDTRTPVAPDLPTFVEAGYPDLVAFTWFALMAPAATPVPILDRLNEAATRAIQTGGVQRRLSELGFTGQTSSRAELASYIRSESERWAPLIKRLGIVLD